MGIKLKNYYKIGILIIILVILIPAIGTVAMYPVFNSRAEESEYAQPNEYLDDYTLRLLTQGSFILYQEAIETQSSQRYSSADLFLSSDYAGREPEYSEDYYGDYLLSRDELADAINQVLYSWKFEFEDIRNSLVYAVYDQEGELIVTNAIDDSLETFGDYNKISGAYIDSYSALITMTYSSMGSLSAKVYSEEQNSIIDYLERYNRENILLEAINTPYIPEAINQPNDIIIFYAIPTDSNLLTVFDYYDIYLAYQDTGFYGWYYAMLLIIAIIAFVLPFIKPLQIGNQKIFRIPLEAAFIIIMYIISAEYTLVGLMADTNSGVFLHSVTSIFNSQIMSSIIVTIVNVFYWALIIALWYISAASILAVISMGFKKYLRERSLFWRAGAWVKGKCVTFLNSLSEIDLEEQTNSRILKVVLVNFGIVVALCCMWFFGILAAIIYSIVIYFLLKKYIGRLKRNYEKLLSATNAMADGNLDIVIEEDLGVFNSFKRELQKIQKGFKKAVEKEVASQNMKTELITNVSHDLKTPLTAIITYVNLLKDENITEEERKNYIETIDNKSMRLKSLIEDLFEVSKADSKNVSLNIISVDLIDLIKQVYCELNDKISEADLEFRMNLPDKKIMMALDSQKTYRIFENLFINCIKYALKGTRVYIDLEENNTEVAVIFKNISASELNFPPEKLTERFIRGDLSRNTEGSGLGLAIARSFLELQNGSLDIEIDGDLFKATTRLYK